MTPEKPHLKHSSSDTMPISTLRCLKMRFSVSSVSISSSTLGCVVAEVADVIDKFLRQILMHATGAHIGRMHARAGGALIEHHQLLALLEAPERRGQARPRPWPGW